MKLEKFDQFVIDSILSVPYFEDQFNFTKTEIIGKLNSNQGDAISYKFMQRISDEFMTDDFYFKNNCIHFLRLKKLK